MFIKDMIESDQMMFGIMQLNENKDDIRFKSMEYLRKKGLFPRYENYNTIYTSTLADLIKTESEAIIGSETINNESDINILNMIYNILQYKRPDDYNGYTVSVSDIIILARDNHYINAYYVDKFGFVELENFRDEIIKNELSSYYILKISYSWGDEENDRLFITEEDAMNEAKHLAVEESFITSSEHECEIGIIYNEKDKEIKLHYTYDDSWCYYKVVKF